MRPVLGIELGPSRCVLVLVDDRREAQGTVRVLSHHVVQYDGSGSLTQDLRRLRVAERLPRLAWVVLWPRPGDAGVTPVDSPVVGDGFTLDLWRLRERLRPIVRAGFHVSGAVTPAQATAALASLGSGSAARDVGVVPGLGGRPAPTPGRGMIGAAAAAAVIVLVLLFWPAPQTSKPGGSTTAGEGVSEVPVTYAKKNR